MKPRQVLERKGEVCEGVVALPVEVNVVGRVGNGGVRSGMVGIQEHHRNDHGSQHNSVDP